MTLAVVQSKFQNNGISSNQTITFPSALTAGNKVYLNAAGSLTNSGTGDIDTANWAIESQNGPGGTSATQYFLSRTVQGGDGATPPHFATGSNTSFRVIGVEVSGGAAVESVVQSTSTSAPISGPTTANNNDLGLLFSAFGSGFGSYTPGSGWTNDQNDGGGSTTADHKAFPSSGSSLTTSPSWSIGGTSGHWMSVALKIAANTETGTGVLSFGSLKFNTAGSAAITASGVLAFGSLKFVAAGVAKHTGTGALHFGSLAFIALGADLGKGGGSPKNPAVTTPNIAELLQPLTYNVAIVDYKTGWPSPEFQRKWQKQFAIIARQETINASIVPQSYVDQLASSTYNAAKTYADSQDAVTLAAAKAYTDSRILPNCLVSALPVSPAHGTRGYVTDATGPTFGNAVVGGGGVETPVYFDGAWKVG